MEAWFRNVIEILVWFNNILITNLTVQADLNLIWSLIINLFLERYFYSVGYLIKILFPVTSSNLGVNWSLNMLLKEEWLI